MKNQKFMKSLVFLFLKQLCFGFDFDDFSVAQFQVKLVFLNFQ